jgi:hypothetical protein
VIIIPLRPLPSQTLTVTPAAQQCDIAIFQKSTGLFLNLNVDGVPTVSTALCHDRVRLVRYAYLGFVGDLCFIDTQGATDPVYTELGTRYVLAYLTLDDVAASA